MPATCTPATSRPERDGDAATTHGVATVVGMSRHITSATILIAVITVLAGCVPGLAADPRFATNSGARPQGAATTKPPPAGPPPIAAPKNDLSWHDCTSRVFADAAVPAAPGVKLDCANYDADLDPVNGGSGTAEHWRGPRPLESDPARRRAPCLHHRLRPAVVDAVAGLAVAGGRRRAPQPPHRRHRPPRHGHVEPDRLPRPL